MTIYFPYQNVKRLELAENTPMSIFSHPENRKMNTEYQSPKQVIQAASLGPAGSFHLQDILSAKKKAIIVVDGVYKPTPVNDFADVILAEIRVGGKHDQQICLIVPPDTHGPMIGEEMKAKLTEGDN